MVKPVPSFYFRMCAAILALIGLYIPTVLHAQNTQKRLSLDATGGANYPFFSIPGNVSWDAGLSLRYSISRIFSVSANYNHGVLSGANSSAPDTIFNVRDPENYRNFRNTYNTISGNVNVNLTRLFNITPFFQRYNPYLTAGMGRMYSSLKSERYFGSTVELESFDFFVYNVGIVNKFYINRNFDFQISAIYTGSQTAFLDLIGRDPTYDKYITVTAGVSYKIGKWKENHLDWTLRPSKEEIQKQQKDLENQKKQQEILATYSMPCPDSVAVLNKKLDELAAENETLKKQLQQAKQEIATAAAAAAVAAITKADSSNSVVPKNGKASPGYKRPEQPGVASSTPVLTKADTARLLGKDVELPMHKYNVIIASFRNHAYAYKYADMMRKKGYDVILQKFTLDHEYMRICILSTDDRKEAVKALKKAEATINPETWIYTVPDK